MVMVAVVAPEGMVTVDTLPVKSVPAVAVPDVAMFTTVGDVRLALRVTV